MMNWNHANNILQFDIAQYRRPFCAWDGDHMDPVAAMPSWESARCHRWREERWRIRGKELKPRRLIRQQTRYSLCGYWSSLRTEQQLAAVETETLKERAVKRGGTEWVLRLVTHSFSFPSSWGQIFVGSWGRWWIQTRHFGHTQC